MSELLPEPVMPEDWECCGSDCGDVCVWNMYYRDKAAYDAQQLQLKNQAANKKDASDEH